MVLITPQLIALTLWRAGSIHERGAGRKFFATSSPPSGATASIQVVTPTKAPSADVHAMERLSAVAVGCPAAHQLGN